MCPHIPEPRRDDLTALGRATGLRARTEILDRGADRWIDLPVVTACQIDEWIESRRPGIGARADSGGPLGDARRA
jgi:hypothetical protein